MKNIFTFITLASFLILINSCEGAYDFDAENLSKHVELNSDIAVPLIDASITLEELMPKSDELESFLEIDNEGYMTLKYKFDVSAVQIDEFLDHDLSGSALPDVSYEIAPQIATLGLNKFLKQGNIIIGDPQIKISIKNYWDIPVRFKFKDFYYYKDEEGTDKYPLTGSAITDWTIITPIVAPETFSETEINLNKTTSNIDKLISALPHHISFAAIFETITPSGAYNIPAGTSDSIKMDIALPLDLGLENIVISDTISFGFGDADTTLLEELTIGTVIDNGFPIDINIQFDFVDENGNVITSLFKNGLAIEGGKIDANGKISSSVESTNVSETSKDVIRKILESEKIVYKITLNTTDIEAGKTVKFYSNYQIGIKMGARFKVNPSL